MVGSHRAANVTTQEAGDRYTSLRKAAGCFKRQVVLLRSLDRFSARVPVLEPEVCSEFATIIYFCKCSLFVDAIPSAQGSLIQARYVEEYPRMQRMFFGYSRDFLISVTVDYIIPDARSVLVRD